MTPRESHAVLKNMVEQVQGTAAVHRQLAEALSVYESLIRAAETSADASG